MPLPDVIELIPLAGTVQAEITVPGSKSITNRALILAALARGTTTLSGGLWSEDTQIMAECLQTLGFSVRIDPDPDESCNRNFTIKGGEGQLPVRAGERQPIELYVGNAGTAARFLAAFVCLGRGEYRLSGTARMHERPQGALFQALRELGCRIDSPNDRLPAVIFGQGPRGGKCRVSIEESSQFASALLLSGSGLWSVEVAGANLEEQPYVEMTRSLIHAFPTNGGVFQIEPDASSASYFLGADWLLRHGANGAGPQGGYGRADNSDRATPGYPGASGERGVRIAGWPESGWQIDASFRNLIFSKPAMAPRQAGEGSRESAPVAVPLPQAISRFRDLGDSIMTAAVLAPFNPYPVRLTDLGRLRVQETERVRALRTELSRCGAEVIEEADTLVISPSADKLHGAEIETYEDHRMAMSFALLGLRTPGIRIKNPACVKKTFPDFFQKLFRAPPRGLGAKILDPKGGRTLCEAELFAE